MEARLERKPLNFYKNLFNTCATHEETIEMIVPDALPDIQRIIDSDGVVILRSKEAEPGKASIGGIINATVLFVPEGENEVYRLEIKMPFTAAYENAVIDQNTRLTAFISLCAIDCRIINPRKILIRADVLTRISGYGPSHIELCSAAQDDKSIEILQEKNTLKTISDVREKTFVISDEYSLPASKPMVGEILKSNCKIIAEDMKTVGSKLIVKGTASVFIVYRSKSDGEIVSAEFSSVFSQIIEIEPSEEPDFAVTIMPTGIFFDTAEGPNASAQISMELHAVAQVVVMENKAIEYIKDAYSIQHEIKGLTEAHSIDTVSNRTMRETIKVSAETPIQARNVVSVSAFTGKTFKNEDENGCRFETPITVSIIYKSEDGRLLSVISKTAVKTNWEDSCENVAYVACVSCGEAVASPAPGGIDMRISLDILVTAIKPQPINTITNISYDETQVKDISGMPSVTVKRVNGDETLWSMAKRYNSTKNLIMDANGLEAEPEFGKLVLIPKRR